ncbi:MAG: hypothetical protein HC811_08450 [Flammeovirgaceae bacterium]|nr:hypothetical protein [Flammeovirgaceae bacterium]
MKHILIVFLFALLVSCGKEDMAPTAPINDTFDPATATKLKMGTFENKVHVVSGTATIYDSNGKKYYFSIRS